uniref:NADH-ubiquinone oxidoreductase chain 4 n=1 Tax=Samaris cristatus TaxID=366934 RepID=A0A0A6Z593_9PLEU|nr:NADH dehydrogenase subunit 4 [Samaris cristatus]AFE62090.1 NADH dehydrogenase subunit 4 [Samaris cristatus]
MLKLIILSTMLIPVCLLVSAKWLWTVSLTYSFIIAIISFQYMANFSGTTWAFVGPYTAVDPISAPLLTLTCWLLPLMILASQGHMMKEPLNHQRTYLVLMTLLQTLLIAAFSATNLLLFYVMFEATLIPTLFIITRWGNQLERLNAGTHILFYTLTGGIPLLVALLVLQTKLGSLSLYVLPLLDTINLTPATHKLWTATCLFAFLVKLPMYGVHLWLPKAHVEAPVAGSMILAAVLLKLGGYGMIRMMSVMEPLSTSIIYPLVIISLWGMIMTGAICLRQTDTKLLIAYSSVSHMGLVASGVLIQTPWGFTGAMIMMISHGLTSSALFCLANTAYERTHSRSMMLVRGLHTLLPLVAAWWLITSLANLALPPLPNLMGELVIMTSLFGWSPWTIVITGLATLITACYTLYLLVTTQRGPIPDHIKNMDPMTTREHLMVILHIVPLILLILKPELISA